VKNVHVPPDYIPMRERTLTSIAIPGGRVEIKLLEAGRSRVHILADPGAFCPRSHVETAFPLGLLSEIAAAHGLGTCEDIARHEEQDYVRGKIATQINSCFESSAFAGKRLLDFGCGSGASSFSLAEILPQTEVVGVDLGAARILTARRIAQIPATAECAIRIVAVWV